MQSQLASIIMPAYNAGRYIRQAIESVLAQTFQAWELIIVNDGSTDSTPDIISQYASPAIKVYHQPNGGESKARNTALRHAQGEWITFLDADDMYLPHHLEVVADHLHTHPEYDGVYTDGYYCDQNNVRLKTLSSRRRGPFTGDIFEQMVRASDVFGAPVCVALRHDVITRYELGFDPGIVIGPDWDFLTRFAEIAPFGYVDQSTCLYRIHQTNISLRAKSEQRALSLARCREKAINLRRFRECSVETRAWVFHDLLINLLTGWTERQLAAIQSEEFNALPESERAHLFRLMASKALLHGYQAPYVQSWLHQSRELNPADRVGAALSVAYRVNPRLCRLLLSARTAAQTEVLERSPFADIFPT